MKHLITAVLATALTMGTTIAFAQASGAMVNDSMGKGAMSHDSNKMSHDSMKKGNKMKKNNAMGMDHPASGAMTQ
jgi:pentapeptide MXKDX repeat protein